MTTPTIPWSKPADIELVDGAEYLVQCTGRHLIMYMAASWSESHGRFISATTVRYRLPDITAAVRLTPYEEKP